MKRLPRIAVYGLPLLFWLTAIGLGQASGQDLPFLSGLLGGNPGTAEAPNNARFTTSLSQYDDDWVASLYGAVDITERVTMTVELDTTGYIAGGAGYGFPFSRSYVEPFFNYGRSDFVDLYDLGSFGVYQISPKLSLYGAAVHQWRITNAFPILGFDILDQRELIATLGLSYQATDWLDVDTSVNHGRLLAGNRGPIAVENDNITSGTVALYFKPKIIEPFFRYTFGQYRVSPGDPVVAGSSFEFGVRLSVN